MAGNGLSPVGLKQTWRTEVVLMMEWIAPRSYIPEQLLVYLIAVKAFLRVDWYLSSHIA
jgi:hypothetical protein